LHWTNWKKAAKSAGKVFIITINEVNIEFCIKALSIITGGLPGNEKINTGWIAGFCSDSICRIEDTGLFYL